MNTKIVVGVLLIACIGTFVIMNGDQSKFNIYPEPHSSQILSQADWSKYYTSVGEVIADSDAIVFGEVTVSEVTSTSLPSAPGHISNYRHTDHTFRIDAVYKGKVDASSIVIEQSGDTGSYIADSPQLPLGKQIILCLYEYAPGQYNIVGGPQGRYHVIDNEVYSLGEVFKPSAETCKDLNVNGLSLESFIKLIK